MKEVKGGSFMSSVKELLEQGHASLGIEFGSTRIKAVLVDDKNQPIASGGYGWENQFVNNIWTYNTEDMWKGLQECYSELRVDVKNKYDVELTKLAAIGISGMMHGYLVFDKEKKLLAPFRTWRNTMTEQESKELTELFQYNIPQRWSIAHLYQEVNKEADYLHNADYETTLAGYIHWMLTGERVLGVGEASGMFPIDIDIKSFNTGMMGQFDEIVSERGYTWKLGDIFPTVLVAGQSAGTLTEEGVKLLDVSGTLEAGIPMCPPESDGGTGMVATNSVTRRTANVSAGTSIFAMVVLEKDLEKVHEEIDLVTTPAGDLVAMAQCNNCTSDLNAWVNIFGEFAKTIGAEVDMNTLYGTLYNKALEGDADCGGLLAYNYLSGEHVTGLDAGRPMFVRTPDSKFNLANFMRTHLFTSLAGLKIGMDILTKEEKVQIDSILGHGGLFKTQGVGQSMLAAAMNAPVSVMETAGEGGAWGIALLASYLVNKEDETLDEFLSCKCFADAKGIEVQPNSDDVTGFETFARRYREGIEIEKAAVKYFN